MNPNTESLLIYLRQIQLEWLIQTDDLAKILKIDQQRLSDFLALTPEQEALLPTIPNGLELAPHLVRIFQVIKRRIPDTEKQLEWLQKSHDLFDGHAPIQLMFNDPSNLMFISYSLDSSSSLS